MTKKSNTELARIRAAAKALRTAQQPAAPQSDVMPALHGVIADARDIIARELRTMKTAQGGGLPMSLGDAKKLQALLSSLSATQTVEKGLTPDTENLTDEELAAELRKLGEGS